MVNIIGNVNDVDDDDQKDNDKDEDEDDTVKDTICDVIYLPPFTTHVRWRSPPSSNGPALDSTCSLRSV